MEVISASRFLSSLPSSSRQGWQAPVFRCAHVPYARSARFWHTPATLHETPTDPAAYGNFKDLRRMVGDHHKEVWESQIVFPESVKTTWLPNLRLDIYDREEL